MALPDLRHFRDGGIYSNPVEALVGEAWVPAIYTDKGWATADGANLLTSITEWRTPCLNTPVPVSPRSQRQKKGAKK
jgi:hypothetical protein